MSYFENVYLERANMDGYTSQERIQTSKERTFLNFLEKSIYKVQIQLDSMSFFGSLKPNKQDEMKITCILLIAKQIKLSVGTILNIFNTEINDYDKWLLLDLDEYAKNGSNRYLTLKLNRTIQWENSIGEIQSDNVYLAGKLSEAIEDLFKVTGGIDLTREPDRVIHFIMKTNDNLKKDSYLEIEDEAWKVTGIDKLSVPGVSYITLKETPLRIITNLPLVEGEEISEPVSFWLGGTSNGS